mmetsp:Transcript_8293/g.20964  ORF Transcript_8293/g.20964 Transcript_8293/m.20964 type:complete len:391 (-) Transcript_8293:280-1452(-)
MVHRCPCLWALLSDRRRHPCHEVLELGCVARESLHGYPRALAIRRGSDWPGKHLKKDDAEAVDITARIPRPSLPRLGWDVPRRTANAAPSGIKGPRQTKIGEHRSGRLVRVTTENHDVGLLDVAVHDGSVVQERQAFQALSEEPPPPVLCQVHSLARRVLQKVREVASEAGLVHEVVVAGVLEHLERFRDVLAVQAFHQAVFGNDLVQSSCILARLLVHLHAVLRCAPSALGAQVRDALTATPKLVDHLIPGLRHGRNGHVGAGRAAELGVLLPEELPEHPFRLMRVKRAVMVEVEPLPKSVQSIEKMAREPQLRGHHLRKLQHVVSVKLHSAMLVVLQLDLVETLVDNVASDRALQVALYVLHGLLEPLLRGAHCRVRRHREQAAARSW